MARQGPRYQRLLRFCLSYQRLQQPGHRAAHTETSRLINKEAGLCLHLLFHSGLFGDDPG